VFSLPSHGIQHTQAEPVLPIHLAYVEWFKPLSGQAEPHHQLYKVRRSLKDGQRMASIIPVSNISRSAHLVPQFDQHVAEEWKSWNVLELSPSFYLNSCSDRHAYVVMS
jgi:hypothetical protein